MGISNFTKLIAVLDGEEQWNEPFDSILIDAQGLLYVAIDQCFPYDENVQNDATHEARFFEDVSSHVRRKLAELVLDVFKKLSPASEKEIVIVCSFDGRGVPMKWPTQRKRRMLDGRSEGIERKIATGKNAYRVSLLGNNVISAKVQNDLVKAIVEGRFHETLRQRQQQRRRQRLPEYLRYVVSGCDVEGEGEHKIFHVAEALGLRSPVVVSADNDAFVLGFLRVERFECIQLYRDSKRDIYNLTHFARDVLDFPVEVFAYVSFLFGNDFSPPVLSLTDNNASFVADALLRTWEETLLSRSSSDTEVTPERMPAIFRAFLREMRPHMRYEKDSNRTPADSETTAVRFWTVCLWTLDYYTRRDFPQKRVANLLWDGFDRNVLLTVLLSEDPEAAEGTFRRALHSYNSHSVPKELNEEKGKEDETAENIFDSETLAIVSRFLKKDGESEGLCHDIKISTSKRKTTTTSETERFPKKPARNETPRI